MDLFDSYDLHEIFQLLEGWQNDSKHQHKELMAAIDNLTKAVTKISTSIDAAAVEIAVPHPTETAVQQAADTLNAQSARLDAAVAAANPTPTPAPAPAPTPAPVTP